MSFFEFCTAIVAIGGSFVFVIAIIKMSMQHKIRLEKIRHGYPVESVDGRGRRDARDFGSDDLISDRLQ